jgi:hypothetical protein
MQLPRKKKKATAFAKQKILNKKQLSCNNGGTVGNGVFYSVRAKGLYNDETSRARIFPCGGGVEHFHHSPASRRS